MRVALYHNLPQGGALRFLTEVVQRSSSLDEYDLYRVVDRLGTALPSTVSNRVHAVHDVHPRLRLDKLVKGRPAPRPVRLAAIWDAEAEVAERIDVGAYDLCLVNSCWLTHSPLLLTRLQTPSLYFVQEPRRISGEAQLRHSAFSSGPLARRAYLRAADAVLRRTDARAVKAADQLACNSAFSAESIFRAYGRDAHVVRLGVDQELFRPSGSGRKDYVLSVGALEPVKGHAMVINAIGSLPKGQRPALKIVHGRAFAGMEADLRELALDRGVALELLSGVSDLELAELYSAARLTACAARLEPFGLTPLESLSCGTPVIAINEGGFRETVIDGYNGILVQPTPTDMAAGMIQLLQGTLGADRQLLRDTVATSTWDRTVEDLHRVYDLVVTEDRERSK